MDIFALYPTSPGYDFITEDTYFEKTQRRFPWATHTKSVPKSPLYLATCPECKNAIEIRELDRVRGENERAPMEPFGKHYQHNVPGLDIIYDQAKYDNCSLRAKVSLSSSEPRLSQAFNDEVLKLLVNEAAVVREVLATTVGIGFGDRLFESMLKTFIEQGRYRCKGVMPSNLPFALLYWTESQWITGQYVSSEKHIEIERAIENSQHFCMSGRQISSKHWRDKQSAAARDKTPLPSRPDWGPHRLAFFMGKRVVRGDERKGEKNHMTLTLTEHTNNKPTGNPIYKKKISYSNNHFPNAIRAFERRMSKPEEAAETLAKRIRAGKLAYSYAKHLLPDTWRPNWEGE
ncbi:hypothetical protein H3H37_20585 [Duganella sp. LX20W]|uniref:Uncharacterized protein n=1 Tax=Rugamonas brunnea TaxID=2758569 RepID=A0A7W2IDI8_9BURK|nr:hypothetical protein [Rugamonas brunnea]MBA5639464.1 hypothetical protein [Rugamonas brunnea]